MTDTCWKMHFYPHSRLIMSLCCIFQGATVKNEGESVIISRIVKGGTADKSGRC